MRLEQILNEEQINDLYYDEGIGDVARAAGRGLAKVGSGLAKGAAGVTRAGAIGAGGIAGGLMGAWDAAKQGYQWGRGAVGQGEFGGAPPLVRSSSSSAAPVGGSSTAAPANPATVRSVMQTISNLPPQQQQQIANRIRQNIRSGAASATPTSTSATPTSTSATPTSTSSTPTPASSAPTPAAPTSTSADTTVARTGTDDATSSTTAPSSPGTPRRPTVMRGGRSTRRVEPTIPGDTGSTTPASSITPTPSSTDNVAASAEARRVARQRAAQNRIDREMASGPATPMDRVRGQAQMVASNPPPRRQPPSGSFAGREEPANRGPRAALPPSNIRRLPPPTQAESIDSALLNRIVRKSQIILDRKL